MALPGDLTTFTLTFGPYTDVKGDPVLTNVTGTLRPSTKLLHAGTGRQILESPIKVTIDAFGVGSVGPLPHTDNAAVTPTGFTYQMVWDLTSNAPSPGNLQFAVPASAGTTIDFDLLVPAPSVAPVQVALPSVISVAGLTGAPTAQQLAGAMDAPLRAAFGTPWADAEILDVFTGKSGAIGGQRAVSGQTWTAFSPGFPLTVSGGLLTDTYSGSGVGAGYASLQAAGSLSYIAAEFAFTAGTADGNLTLVAWANEIGAYEAAHGGQLPASPCHFVLLPSQWLYMVVDGAGAITTLATGNYSTLTQDGSTMYKAEAVIDQAAQTAYLRLPDGSVATVGPDSRIGVSAPWFCVEDYYNVGTTAAKARTRSVAATSAPIGHDPRASVLRTLALGAPTTPAWTDVTLNAPYTNVSGRPVQMTKDPRGRVHMRGVAQTNGGTSAAKLCVLPAAFRPTQDIKVPASVGYTEYSVSLSIAQNGDVYPTSATDWGFWYFDGVSFATA